MLGDVAGIRYGLNRSLVWGECVRDGGVCYRDVVTGQ